MSKAEAYEVNFGDNKSIDVNVNFTKGDAIKVPVNINSLDVEKVATEIAAQLQLPEIDTTELAQESTLQEVSAKLDNLNVDVDLSLVAKQGDNQEATNSAIYDAVKNIPDLSLLYAARAEKNNDGENTYSIILPVSAKAIIDNNGVATIQL